MNELIKVNYDSDRPTVLGRDLHDFLMEPRTFEELFIVVNELRVSETNQFLRTLQKEFDYLASRYNGELIAYLKDLISTELMLPCRRPEREYPEKQMVRDICNNINAVRPGIEVIQTEVEVEGIGRIDILAKEKKTRQHAIIEVKASQQNPNTQLLAYGVKYDNPILIAITKVPIPVERQLPGIEYIVYTAT